MLNHLDARNLLAKYDVVLEGDEYTSVEAAKAQLAKGGTFFLKLVSSSEEATHKTEFGYVRRVASPAELVSAWEEMEKTAILHNHKDTSFILQEGRDGYEVMIGAKRDPIFGFQTIFTPEGGKYAEIYAKISPPVVRVGSLSVKAAREMITEHPLSARILGARGELSVDKDALAGLIASISTLMDENPDVSAIDLNPVFATPYGLHIVDARIEIKPSLPTPHDFHTRRDLTVFKEPKRVVAVVASGKANSVGYVLIQNLSNTVPQLYVMLPSGKGREDLEVLGHKPVDEIPDGCDLLVYAGLPSDAPRMVAEFRRKGGAGAAIISSDFAETGHVELERQLFKSAGDMPYIGPNGLGVYAQFLNTFFIGSDRTAYPKTGGALALFSQSGGMCLESFMEYLCTHNVPVNEVFSLGNGSGISFTELLNSVADNQTVNCVVVHLEGGLKEGEGPYFIEALKKAARVKPVIVLPAGLSRKGRECAASHTGRMTGGADALMSGLRQGGAILARSEEQLRMALWMLHVMPRASDKAVVFTVGGGKGVCATDVAEQIGLELRSRLPIEFEEAVKSSMPPFADCGKNPFDFTGSVTLDGILAILEHSKLLNSPGVLHFFFQVPGVTLRRRNGEQIKMSVTEAGELIASRIRDLDLPFVLNICSQCELGSDVEKRCEQQGIVVTRESPAHLTLSALQLTIDVWKRYPLTDFRGEKLTEDLQKNILTSIR